MRYLPILLSLGAGTVTAQSMTKCIADNCLRAIRASAFPDRSGYADCVSFFQGGVVGGGGTITTTETTIVSETISIQSTTVTVSDARPPDCKCKRQAPPPAPAIPGYASKCSGISRYSSACACIGVTETAAPTTTTVTETSTTIVATAGPTATVLTFVIQLLGSSFGVPLYVALRPDGFAGFSSDITEGVQFYLKPDGQLEVAGGVPVGVIDEAYEGVGRFVLDGRDSLDFDAICQISATQDITCQAGPHPQLDTLGITTNANGFVLGLNGQLIIDKGGELPVVKAVPPWVPA